MKVAVVGNAPNGPIRAAAIDGADLVVRFNNVAGFGRETGTKTSQLWLINCGGQMQEWLTEPGFLDRPPVRSAEAFVLPVDPKIAAHYEPPLSYAEWQDARAQDWTAEAIARLSRLGKPIMLVPAGFYRGACCDLGEPIMRRGMPVPSTGFLAVRYLLETLPESARLVLYRFGFAGWRGHDWAAERAWVEHRQQRCEIVD